MDYRLKQFKLRIHIDWIRFALIVPTGERIEGNEWDDVYRHGYIKVSDDNNRQSCPHRARLEFRLQGPACPFSTVDELLAFDWLALAPWFRFRRLKDDVPDVVRIAAETSVLVGKKRTRPRAVEGGARQFSRITLADNDLRNRAYDALRTLNKRWHRTPARKCKSDSQATIDRSKAGTFEDESRAVAGSVRITTQCNTNTIPATTSDTTHTIVASATAEPHVHRSRSAAVEILDGIHGLTRSSVTEISSRPIDEPDFSCLDDILDEINDLPATTSTRELDL